MLFCKHTLFRSICLYIFLFCTSIETSENFCLRKFSIYTYCCGIYVYININSKCVFTKKKKDDYFVFVHLKILKCTLCTQYIIIRVENKK